jgi:hypothetical protein
LVLRKEGRRSSEQASGVEAVAMARSSGGVGAPARSGARLTEYLDGPDDIQRRAASFTIVRSDAARDDGPRVVDGPRIRDDRRTPSSRRASLSWLRSRALTNEAAAAVVDSKVSDSEKGWRSWRPVRALTHLRMRRAGCLFSIEVAGARGLPPAVEGRRLAVTVCKVETRDGAVQSMPCRVRDGGAEFDETLFVRCSLYFTGGKGTGKPLRLELRRFLVSVLAVDASVATGRGVHHHHLGTHAVDVSALVLESVERSSEGRRVKWFDRTVALSGKAAGGELLLKLGFQLMEDAGLSLYTQTAGERDIVPPAGGRAWAHNRKSFSISSASSTPKLSATTDDAVSPSMRAYTQLIDRLRIDERGDDVVSLKKHGEEAAAGSPAIPQKAQTKQPAGDDEAATDPRDTHSIPEFEVAEKGVETVKEAVHYQAHRNVLRELDSIAAQIVAIEALMTSGGAKTPKAAAEDQQQRLDADEEMVTMDFLRKLELDVDKKLLNNKQQPLTPRSQSPSPRKVAGVPPVVPDLGPSLGPVVQTRDGGFLVSMNPFDLPLASRDEPPKLAMQVSRPFVLPGAVVATGFQVLQYMAEAAGSADEVCDSVAAFGGMDDLKGKAPAQVGFEGIAKAVIGGRRTEGGATSSAALSVQLVRRLAAAATAGRSERVATGIWTAGDDPETLDEVLAFSLQKLEAMALDALAVQVEMADEHAPFEVGAAVEDGSVRGLFDSLVPCDAWSESGGGGSDSDGCVTLVAAVQLRDPSRRYEAVGAPMVVVVQSARLVGASSHSAGRFKVRSLNVGGVQVRSPSSGAGGSASWSAERQKLTAVQWMLAHGPARPGKRTPTTWAAQTRARLQQRPDVVWSLSSRVIAGMWLKTVRNPDVRIGGGSSCDQHLPTAAA